MRSSPLWPKVDELGDYVAHEFDAQAKFFQLSNEVKQHFKETNLVFAIEILEDAENPSSSNDKKCKKSWKATLFSWMRSKKKSKPQVCPENVARKSKQRKGHVPSPIHGNMGTCRLFTKPCRLTSGPLSRLFTPLRSQNDMRYVSLEKLQNTDRSKPYGPVYLVT